MSMEGIQKISRQFGGVIAKNSPTILTGISVAGIITTTIMAVKATPKALRLLEDERYNRSKKDGPNTDVINVKDTVLLTWRCYVPSAIIGALTIGCIISANSINSRRNAALAGLYSLSEIALKEYQAKVVETIGENKERNIRDDIAKDRIDRNPVSNKEVVITGRGETLCYDSLSGRYFKSDIEYIRKVFNDLNRQMLLDGSITLNEVYYALDLQGTKLGDMMCWHADRNLIEPDFSSQLTNNGIPCLVLDYIVDPSYIY